MRITYREDDINKNTPVEALRFTHRQFLNSHVNHTISFVCQDLEQNKPLVDYINRTTNWEFCIHGWTHDNYCLMSRDRIAEDLDKCILKIEELFGQVPEKWYLPWNGWTKENGFDLVPKVADIAIYHGIDVDTDCDHIGHAVNLLENKQKLPSRTVYFHGWDVNDLKLLPSLLFLTRKT